MGRDGREQEVESRLREERMCQLILVDQ